MQRLGSLTVQSAQRGTTRRRFIGQALAGGAALPAAIGALSRSAQAAPQKGGHLKLGLQGGATSDSLDPTTINAPVQWAIGRQFGNSLVEVTASGEAIGELADQWDATELGKRWSFKLKKGVIFHNGKEMSSSDVVYSLNRHRGPDSKSGAAGSLQNIAEVKADGRHNVLVELKEPDADLPYILSDYHLLIQPEGVADGSGTGTGPYQVIEAQPGVRYLTRRNPNYFRSDCAWVDSVETLVINDPTARLASLQSGQVHIINRVDPKLAALLNKSQSASAINVAGRGHYVFLMHCDKPPFDNADLRRALKYSIDRKEMVERILAGYGAIGNDQPINSAYPLAPSDIPQYEFDPEKARFFYQRSGHSGPISLHTSDVAFSGAVDAAVLLKTSAEKAGITIDVKREPGDGYWDKTWNVVPFCASFWGGRPTQDQMLSIAYLSDAPWNDTKWHRPAFDDIVRRARAELDEQERKALYRTAALMIHDDGGVLVPMFNDFIDGVRSEVQGFIKDTNAELSGMRVAERVWLGA